MPGMIAHQVAHDLCQDQASVKVSISSWLDRVRGGMQVWIGTKQKELEAGSMQLMHQYTPWATGLLAVLIPVFEPLGLSNPTLETILGFNYTFTSVTAIAGSAVSELKLYT